MNKNKKKNLIKNTGRGVIYITLAKAWFMIAGWALVFILPRLFKWSEGGDDQAGMELYGIYGLVITGVSFINNGIITGTIQSVSKFTAHKENFAKPVRLTAMKTMFAAGLIIAGVYSLLSTTIATVWFKSSDQDLVELMQLSSIIIIGYSLYAVFIGTLNGRQLFKSQALFDIGYTTVKIVAILSMVALGFGTKGAVSGFVFTAVIAAVAGWLYTRKSPGEGKLEYSKFISFASTLFVYTFILNLLLMVDIYVLGGFISRIAEESGMVAEKAQSLMHARAAQYKAVQQLSFIPYQAVLSIAFVIFPLISKVTSSEDSEAAKRYIKKTFRFTLILLAGFASVFSGVAKEAMELVFPDGYSEASPAMRVLSLGIIAFALMTMSNTILNAAGKKWHALAVVIVGFVTVIITSSVLLNTTNSHGIKALEMAAWGTSTGMFVALIVSMFFIYKNFKVHISLISVAKVIVATIAAIGLAGVFPQTSGLLVLGKCISVLVFYYFVLVILKEFNKDDLKMIKQVIKK